MTIWKFPLAVTHVQMVQLPAGAEVLTVQVQHGGPCLWARVDPSNPPVARRVFIHGTGHECHADAAVYLGTFQLADGEFVGHVFTDRPT